MRTLTTAPVYDVYADFTLPGRPIALRAAATMTQREIHVTCETDGITPPDLYRIVLDWQTVPDGGSHVCSVVVATASDAPSEVIHLYRLAG